MENYLPEGEAKGHENNGKIYSQRTELEPDQGNLPPGWGLGNICQEDFRISTDQWLLSLLQWTVYFCYLCSANVCWVGEYSASTNFHLPFLTYMKSFLPSPWMVGLAIWVVLASECEQKLWMCLHHLTWPLRLLHSHSLPKEEFGSGAIVLVIWVQEWKNHGTFLKLTTTKSGLLQLPGHPIGKI